MFLILVFSILTFRLFQPNPCYRTTRKSRELNRLITNSRRPLVTFHSSAGNFSEIIFHGYSRNANLKALNLYSSPCLHPRKRKIKIWKLATLRQVVRKLLFSRIDSFVGQPCFSRNKLTTNNKLTHDDNSTYFYFVLFYFGFSESRRDENNLKASSSSAPSSHARGESRRGRICRAQRKVSSCTCALSFNVYLHVFELVQFVQSETTPLRA